MWISTVRQRALQGVRTMNRIRKLAVAALLAAAPLLSAACDSPADPSDESVQLVTQISRNVIPPTGTATLTFRLENVSDKPITLHFSSGCQILPYIATRSDSRIVYPSGGGWACTAIVSELMLKPGEIKTQDVIVQGATSTSLPAPGNVPLAAGDYSAYARVEAMGVEVQSASVPFIVQSENQ
jgi:hypothetical protein